MTSNETPLLMVFASVDIVNFFIAVLLFFIFKILQAVDAVLTKQNLWEIYFYPAFI